MPPTGSVLRLITTTRTLEDRQERWRLFPAKRRLQQPTRTRTLPVLQGQRSAGISPKQSTDATPDPQEQRRVPRVPPAPPEQPKQPPLFTLPLKLKPRVASAT